MSWFTATVIRYLSWSCRSQIGQRAAGWLVSAPWHLDSVGDVKWGRTNSRPSFINLAVCAGCWLLAGMPTCDLSIWLGFLLARWLLSKDKHPREARKKPYYFYGPAKKVLQRQFACISWSRHIQVSPWV